MAQSRIGGYAGKTLRVDLTRGELAEEIYDERFLRKWIGGIGLAGKSLVKALMVAAFGMLASLVGIHLQLVASYISDPGVLVARPNSPYKSIKELVDAAKANPGKVRITSLGVMTTGHVATVKLQKAADAKFAHTTPAPPTPPSAARPACPDSWWRCRQPPGTAPTAPPAPHPRPSC